jgi:hypothetical protein
MEASGAHTGQPHEQRQRQQQDAAQHRQVGDHFIQGLDRQYQVTLPTERNAIHRGARAIWPGSGDGDHLVGPRIRGSAPGDVLQFVLRNGRARTQHADAGEKCHGAAVQPQIGKDLRGGGWRVALHLHKFVRQERRGGVGFHR